MAAFSPRTFKLTIIDDGQGFDLEQAVQNRNGRLGLLGMKERAESLGGSLAIWTQPQQGTRVELTVPVKESEPGPNGV